MTSKANARQIDGDHYKNMNIQPWDLWSQLNLDPFQASILKYVLRWKIKNGVVDLEKAQHFLEKYIEEVAAGRVSGAEVEPEAKAEPRKRGRPKGAKTKPSKRSSSKESTAKPEPKKASKPAVPEKSTRWAFKTSPSQPAEAETEDPTGI